MPNIRKHVITETEVVPPPHPQDRTPEPVAVTSLGDFMDRLTPDDWALGELYLYQIEPPVTKRQGEYAYADKYKEPLDENMVRARLPNATEASVIFKWPRASDKAPITFRFALSPYPHPMVNVSPTTQIAFQGSEGKVIELAQNLAEKLSKAQSPDAIQKAHEMSMGLVNTTYQNLLANAASGREEKRSLVQELSDLRAAGFLPGPGAAPPSDPTEAIVLRLKNEGLLKPEKEEEFTDKIKKIADTALLLGFRRAEGGAASESWKGIFAQNIPELSKAVMYVADKFVEGMAMSSRGMAPEIPPPNPAMSANGGRASAPPPATSAPSAEAVLDEFIKTKLLEMWQAGLPADEVIAWIEITAEGVLDMLRGKPLPMVAQYFSSDPILKQVVANDAGKQWLEQLVKEVNHDDQAGGSAH